MDLPSNLPKVVWMADLHSITLIHNALSIASNQCDIADVADCWGNLARYVATGAGGLQYPLSIRSLQRVPKILKWLGDKDTGAYK